MEVDPTTYYSWKERYESEGIAGLLPKKSGMVPDDVDHRKLEKENQMLKKLVADKELIIEMQLSILKKKPMSELRGKK
ncbi:MAG TPA: helix-turn-helix domain-containing protein [bacterium]|nr:helix-turn-helix domain-containing protein [bacterium]